jgi:hypothetical protein
LLDRQQRPDEQAAVAPARDVLADRGANLAAIDVVVYDRLLIERAATYFWKAHTRRILDALAPETTH